MSTATWIVLCFVSFLLGGLAWEVLGRFLQDRL